MKTLSAFVKPLLLAAVLGGTVSAAQAQQPAAPFVFDPNALPVAQTGFYNNVNVQHFMHREAAAGRQAYPFLQDFFARVQYKPNIIDIINRPGTARPWYEFRRNNASAARIEAGRRFYRQNRQVLDQIARQYGVPAEMIVAILGIETHYGRNMGSFRLADSLPTLAFGFPRRAEFFQQELSEFLMMAAEERRDVYSFTGSYAGAMGMPQFMPSSYRKWAVDYDGDGLRNIWGSVPDAAASVANYFRAHGWQPGGRIMMRAAVARMTPELEALIDERTSLSRTVGQLRAFGITPLEAAADHEPAVFFRLETAPGQFEYYLGFNNFYTIWQYNHSRMYATAVHDIARDVAAAGR